MIDPHHLHRFLEAQEAVYAQARGEIRAGDKRSHWMWFIFPQLAGLGQSPTAKHFGIRSLEEARAYLDHPVLGERYLECVKALDQVSHSDANQVFGSVDAMKLRSSLTLFAEAGGGSSIEAALRRWFGEPDARTLTLLNR